MSFHKNWWEQLGSERLRPQGSVVFVTQTYFFFYSTSGGAANNEDAFPDEHEHRKHTHGEKVDEHEGGCAAAIDRRTVHHRVVEYAQRV